MRKHLWWIVALVVTAIVSSVASMYFAAYKMREKAQAELSYVKATHSVDIQNGCDEVVALLVGGYNNPRFVTLQRQCLHKFGIHIYPNGTPVPLR
ncbi:hypothetical protein [Burkholderia vietnamiensis]|uniref:hypothetical protein n=1 Tax=Burkholderia vietnamiensis TaxID=60552 RepID=UPI001593CBE8|nr:hypothetical protein [Burkholderia vietnamiensis]MBR8006561.1 hypothetical protein [Burkholderia vietnamiensis]MDN7814691.1 hypothetical protein [Burkholderia vietnamiensis]MDN8042363.1 hypothetical protein [Burkholderia vietnamiensis]HDR9131339.1 hypothetical protein [Burkholderia vietnamiensis]